MTLLEGHLRQLDRTVGVSFIKCLSLSTEFLFSTVILSFSSTQQKFSISSIILKKIITIWIRVSVSYCTLPQSAGVGWMVYVWPHQKAYYCACLSHIMRLQYDGSLLLRTLTDSTVSVWGQIKCCHQLSIRQHTSTPSCCYCARPSAFQSPPCFHRLLSRCH